MKNITAITDELYKFYKNNNITSDICFELNEGGHFNSIPQRMAKAFIFLNK